MTQSAIVRADLPGGNARFLEVRAERPVAEVVFMPSPAGGPEAMWFYFRIEPFDPAPRNVRCTLCLPENLLGGGRGEEGFLPVFRTDRSEWRRVDRAERHELPDGRGRLSWLVPGDRGAAEVALCYPYGQAELDSLAQDLAGGFAREIVGLTQEDRPLERLSNGPGATDSPRPGIYCVARQHAGETPGSWVLDGFLRTLAEAGERAPLVWAVPFVDLDGIVRGRYGKDSYPWDFNRAWGSRGFSDAKIPETGSHPMRHETLCIQNDLDRWRRRCRPALALDFHAPGMRENAGIYCFLRNVDEQGRPDDSHRPWVEAIEASLGTFASEPFVRSGRYLSRWNTARFGDYVTETLHVPQIGIETPYASFGTQVFTRTTYRLAGRRIAEAVLARLSDAAPAA